MFDTSEIPFYAEADVSAFARTPAIIPVDAWAPERDWEAMRGYLEAGLQSKRNWRTPWWMHWGELASNMLARRYHWVVAANNMTRGMPINQNVIDSTPTQAIGVCAAGMMDGLCSPTKAWFKFQPKAKNFELDTAGKRWINEFQERVYDVMAGSNYYDSKHQYYEDQIVFGTSPLLIYENRETVINCAVPCAGEYFLATLGDNTIGCLDREFTQTVRQIVSMYGPDALKGTEVASSWNTKANLDLEYVVGHNIEPNTPAASYGENKNLGVVPGGYAYREYYWLRGKTTPRPLSVRGFHEKPFQAALWNRRSNDPYGRSLGMDALPDTVQLHRMQLRLGEAIDKMVRPPMLADATLKNEPASTQPGRVTYVPNLGKDTGMRPTYLVNPQVEQMEKRIAKLQQQVERWFLNDVFLMISQMEGIQPRNELELNERRGEKLLRLGPAVERNLREDAIGINRIVAIMRRRNLIPLQPASMHGVPIEIKFVSKLAQIQKAVATAGMERTLVMGGRMEAAMPGTLDNINKDRFLRDYGDKLDFPADDWSDNTEMAAIRKARAAQQQAAMQSHAATEEAPAVACAAKTLSETDTGGGLNALQMLVGGGGAGAGMQ